MDLITIMVAVLGITGALGISYASLRSQLDKMETFMRAELSKRPTEHDVRQLISDKLAPAEVAYASLKDRIDELKEDQQRITDKIDQLLDLCSRLANGRAKKS